MKLFKYILLCFSITSYVLCEEVEIIVESTPFTIDTVLPEIELYSPSHGDVFGPDDVILVTWDAADDSPTSSPMTLNVSAYLDDPYMELASNFPNTGSLELNVPDFINTLFASVRLDITDYYGNTSYAYSNGYFTIGNPNEGMYDVVNETVNIQNTSEAFEIDTKTPEVVWIFPNQATSFNPLQGQVVRWNATDETLPENPIDLLFIDGGVESYSLSEGVINNGQKFIHLPDIETSLGHFKVIATDSYGNVGYDLSDEYMSIGEDSDTEVQDESVTIEVESEPFEIDTKLPLFALINENDYFYPNGGELLTDYNNINFNWNTTDDSFENGEVEVSLAYLLGGWYTSLGTFEAQNPYNAIADFSIDGLVENTIWARLIYTAIDDYGNSNSKYSDDYFTLGSSDGNISADLYDEENIDMFISWTWENQKHNIKFNHRALENLQHGDQIVIVGENSIQSADCLTPLGVMNLGSSEIQAQGWGGNNSADRIVIDQGVNHCNYGGGALPGYTLGDSIRIQIIGTDASYFLRPSDYRGSLVFDNGMTIIKQFNSTPYNIETFNNDNEDSSDYQDMFITCSSSNLDYQDCSGTCFDNSSCTNNTYDGCIIGDYTWLGDGYCDDGTYGLVFTCDDYGNDCGDCDIQDDPYNICTRNSSTTSNSYSDEFKFYNNTYQAITENGRDWDGFNVYGKVTNHQGSSRSCDSDGMCDSSELLDSYTNENDCTENDGTWDISICYYDYNGDGIYSPDEADENVADCYSDCCSQIGTGDNEDWCFIETVDSEEYTHSLVSSNYLPVNTSSATVNYRVWLLDDQSNEIYKTVDTEDYDIQIGTDDIPDYIKNLSSGWNWISFNIENDNMLLNNIFSNSTLSNLDYIKSQTNSSTYYDAGDGQWYPDWDTDLKSAYLLDIDSEASILYNGTIPNPSDVIIPISEGWNWISYVPTTSYDINTALVNLSPSNLDYIKSQTSSSTYYSSGGVWYPDILLEPTKAYMLKSSSSQSLTYPSIESYTNNTLTRNNQTQSFNYRKFEFNASATISLDMKHLKASINDKISVFYENELRGIAYGNICPLNNKLLFNLMAYSNNEQEEDLTFIYYNEETGHDYMIRETFNFEKDGISGNIYNPIVLTDLNMPLVYELKSPYPNPFNPTTTIEFSLIENQSDFTLNIYDIRGRLVESLYSGYINYGYHKYKWDASRFSSGIYFVHMITDKNIFTKKITLLK